jgi:hypothetical protein
MNHTEVENSLMHLGRLYVCICTRESPTDATELAAWQSKALYIQQAALGCFASYQEDLKLRQEQARQKGNKVALDLLKAFKFCWRALLAPATNTPATQNDGTNPQDSKVFSNPAMEKECQGKSRVQLQANGHWQAHVIKRSGKDWVGALGDEDLVKPLTPAERAQRPWGLEPPPEDAPETFHPTKHPGKRQRKGQKGEEHAGSTAGGCGKDNCSTGLGRKASPR